VILRYWGHAAFEWITPKRRRILIDPFRNPDGPDPWFEKKFPHLKVDLLLVTHPHFDHDASQRVECITVLQSPGEFRGEDFSIRGILDRHVEPYGEQFDRRNVIFVIEIAGIRFCHIGDNRSDIPSEVFRQIGNIDLLMLPVDASNHLLAYDEVENLIESLSPKVVIPNHYFIPGLTDPRSGLGDVEDWLSGRKLTRRIDEPEIRISREDLSGSQIGTETWVFESTGFDGSIGFD
jgi:L-ascorbate metabolism protein UlaG (beta-lactamase superfamily)